MTIENEIYEKLIGGQSVEMLLSQGEYKKSTIYKIKKRLETEKRPASQWSFVIENVKFNGLDPSFARIEPEGRVVVTGQLKNISSLDLYISEMGIMPEWLEQKNEWYSRKDAFLLKTYQYRNFAFTLDVSNLNYDEYTLKFGIIGQWLGSNIMGSNFLPLVQGQQTIWTEPLVIQLKNPYSGHSIFISHSVNDKRVVRQISNYLDSYGIKVNVGPDTIQPGTLLPQKFKALIDQSDMVLAILTENSLRSKWVQMECTYAFQVKKTVVPVKEKSVSIHGSWWPAEVEWIEFSLHAPIQIILQEITDGIRTVIQRAKKSVNPDFIGGLFTGALVVGVLALIFGGSKK